MGFLQNEKQRNNTNATPFDMKKKAPEAKPVKINKDLHQTLKMYTAYGSETMLDVVNAAVEEYIEKYNIKQKIKDRNDQI